MPITDVPEQVSENLPPRAREIWRESYESAKEYYKDLAKRDNPDEDAETVAAKVAWNAAKQKYHKDESGTWVANS